LLEERNDFIPDANLESAELRTMVKKLVMELPQRQREAVILRYYSELNQREIAKIMDVNFQAISQYLALAKKKIKGGIEQYMQSAESELVKSRLALPFGAILAGVLEQEAKLLCLANETALQSIVATVSEVIAGAVPLAGEAVLAGETSIAAEAVAAGAAETAAAATVTSLATKAIIALVCAIALAAMVAAGIYVTVGETGSPALQIQFEGGTSAGEGFIRVNPQDARIGADEVTMLYWWITEIDSEEVVLSGEGYTIAEGFISLRETGERGIHVLHIRSQSEGFTPHTSRITFYNYPR